MPNWRQQQPDLWELLAADADYIEYLNTLKPRSYHREVEQRLKSLINGVDTMKDAYRKDAAELYHKNLVALSKV